MSDEDHMRDRLQVWRNSGTSFWELMMEAKHVWGESAITHAVKQYNRTKRDTVEKVQRKPVPKRWILDAWVKQGGICKRCKLDLDPKEAEGDHIIPFASGGKHTRGNIQALHGVPCNRSKGANSLFRESKLGHGTVLEQLEGANVGEES